MSNLAVIFDVDGVLVDSYQAHFASWSQLYRELGHDYTESTFAADFGRTSRDILRRTLGDMLSEQQIRDLDQRKESLYRDLLRADFPAMFGAVDLIDSLVVNGFVLAVGSSAPPENVALSLDKLGRAKHFTAMVTGADVTRGKPDPQVFLLAAERMGMSPVHCAVVEDAVHGVEAARRAGMTSIGITGTVTRDQLAAADLVIDRLDELSPHVIATLIAGR